MVDIGARLNDLMTRRAYLQAELADVNARIDELGNLLRQLEPVVIEPAQEKEGNDEA